jgi:hypothetical protein
MKVKDPTCYVHGLMYKKPFLLEGTHFNRPLQRESQDRLCLASIRRASTYLMMEAMSAPFNLPDNPHSYKSPAIGARTSEILNGLLETNTSQRATYTRLLAVAANYGYVPQLKITGKPLLAQLLMPLRQPARLAEMTDTVDIDLIADLVRLKHARGAIYDLKATLEFVKEEHTQLTEGFRELVNGEDTRHKMLEVKDALEFYVSSSKRGPGGVLQRTLAERIVPAYMSIFEQTIYRHLLHTCGRRPEDVLGGKQIYPVDPLSPDMFPSILHEAKDKDVLPEWVFRSLPHGG